MLRYQQQFSFFDATKISMCVRFLHLGDELLADGLPSEFGSPLRAAWAELALATGDPEEAARHVDEALVVVGEQADPLYTPALHALGVRAEAERAVRARARRRDADLEAAIARARHLAAELEALVAAWGGDAAAPDALANAALARAELGRVESADEPALWQAAADAWDALAEPHPAAYARLRLAEAILHAGGERAAAGRELAASYAAGLRLGAAPLVDQAAALARRARLPLETAPPPEPAAAEGEPVAALGITAREAEVLCLLAEGLTNREIAGRLFVSQKTVASHLAHIFDKLDVHSRVEAAGRAHQLGLVERL